MRENGRYLAVCLTRMSSSPTNPDCFEQRLEAAIFKNCQILAERAVKAAILDFGTKFSSYLNNIESRLEFLKKEVEALKSAASVSPMPTPRAAQTRKVASRSPSIALPGRTLVQVPEIDSKLSLFASRLADIDRKIETLEKLARVSSESARDSAEAIQEFSQRLMEVEELQLARQYIFNPSRMNRDEVNLIDENPEEVDAVDPPKGAGVEDLKRSELLFFSSSDLNPNSSAVEPDAEEKENSKPEQPRLETSAEKKGRNFLFGSAVFERSDPQSHTKAQNSLRKSDTVFFTHNTR